MYLNAQVPFMFTYTYRKLIFGKQYKCLYKEVSFVRRKEVLLYKFTQRESWSYNNVHTHFKISIGSMRMYILIQLNLTIIIRSCTLCPLWDRRRYVRVYMFVYVSGITLCICVCVCVHVHMFVYIILPCMI